MKHMRYAVVALLVLLVGCERGPQFSAMDDDISGDDDTSSPSESPETTPTLPPWATPYPEGTPYPDETPYPARTPYPGPTPATYPTPTPVTGLNNTFRIKHMAVGHGNEGIDLDGDGAVDNNIEQTLETFSSTFYDTAVTVLEETDVGPAQQEEVLAATETILDSVFTVDAISRGLEAMVESEKIHYLTEFDPRPGSLINCNWYTASYQNVALFIDSLLSTQPGTLDTKGHGLFGPDDIVFTLAISDLLPDPPGGNSDTTYELRLFHAYTEVYNYRYDGIDPMYAGGAILLEDLMSLAELAIEPLADLLDLSRSEVADILASIEATMAPYMDVTVAGQSGFSIGLVMDAEPATAYHDNQMPVASGPPAAGATIDDYFRVTRMEVGQETEGVDLNGDGKVDNGIESLLDELVKTITDEIENTLEDANLEAELVTQITTVVNSVLQSILSVDAISTALNGPVQSGDLHYIVEFKGQAGSDVVCYWYSANFQYDGYDLRQQLSVQPGTLSSQGYGLFGPDDFTATLVFTNGQTGQTILEVPLELSHSLTKVPVYDSTVLSEFYLGGAIKVQALSELVEAVVTLVADTVEPLELTSNEVETIVSDVTAGIESYADITIDGDLAFSVGLAAEAMHVENVEP